MAEIGEVAADPAPTAWEYPTGEGRGPATGASAAMPQLDVDGFAGPLDFLVEMVRRHRIDLGRLAILPLIDQFVAALERARESVPLERRGDWLVMASTLLLLKAQLLWPPTPAVAAAAEASAVQQLRVLDELARTRAAAAWLAARPQLGIDVFPRGRSEQAPPPQAALYVAFLEATLVMLEGRAGDPPAASVAPVHVVLDLWRVPEAVARVKQMLAEDGTARPLGVFLPRVNPQAAHQALRRRAAVASTLMAGLELARDGQLITQQDATFGDIHFAAASTTHLADSGERKPDDASERRTDGD